MKRAILALAFLLLAPVPGAAGPVAPGGVPVPDDPALPPNLAAVVKAFQNGDVEGALRGAREYVKEQPNSAVGYELLGAAARAKGDFKEAERALGEALRIEPGRWSAMVQI